MSSGLPGKIRSNRRPHPFSCSPSLDLSSLTHSTLVLLDFADSTSLHICLQRLSTFKASPPDLLFSGASPLRRVPRQLHLHSHRRRSRAQSHPTYPRFAPFLLPEVESLTLDDSLPLVLFLFPHSIQYDATHLDRYPVVDQEAFVRILRHLPKLEHLSLCNTIGLRDEISEGLVWPSM